MRDPIHPQARRATIRLKGRAVSAWVLRVMVTDIRDRRSSDEGHLWVVEDEIDAWEHVLDACQENQDIEIVFPDGHSVTVNLTDVSFRQSAAGSIYARFIDATQLQK